MPKIIPDLENKIVCAARNVLFTEGYEALSMRRMANDCHIAVGTIYNYVKDKDELIAKVALRDWLAAVDEITAVNEKEKDFAVAMLNVLNGVRSFRAKYTNCWSRLESAVRDRNNISFYHPRLRSAIAKLVEPFIKCEGDKKNALENMLAELIISTVAHPDIDDETFCTFIKAVDVN